MAHQLPSPTRTSLARTKVTPPKRIRATGRPETTAKVIAPERQRTDAELTGFLEVLAAGTPISSPVRVYADLTAMDGDEVLATLDRVPTGGLAWFLMGIHPHGLQPSGLNKRGATHCLEELIELASHMERGTFYTIEPSTWLLADWNDAWIVLGEVKRLR